MISHMQIFVHAHERKGLQCMYILYAEIPKILISHGYNVAGWLKQQTLIDEN